MALRKWLFFRLFCFCFCSVLILSYSETDTLKQGHQLNDGEYLISAGKVFTLGFFSPKEQKAVGYFTPESAQNRYIGIWYTYDEDKKPVWVANRNNPFSKESGSLEIDRNGNLRIVHKGLTAVVLSSYHGTTKTVAVLSDNGNFVLRQLSSSDDSVGGKVLCQSFDHPTDTLLPGMRLGFNFKTGQNWSLSSWVNNQVPALGPFTLGADPNGTNQLMMWRRGKIHWCSGIWNDSKFQNLIDDLYSFEYVSNKDERYFTLSLVNNWHIKFPMYQINGEGVISKLDFYRLGDIGLFLSGLVNCRLQTPGCVEQKMPECRSTKYRFFERSKGYVISEGFKYEAKNHILGMDDCEAKCLSNCSCVAYAAIYSNGTGCQFWSDITHLVVDEYRFVDSAYREVYVQKEYNLRVLSRQRYYWWVWFIVGTISFLLLLSFAWLGMRFRTSMLKIAHCIVLSFCVLGNIIQQSLKNFLLWLNDHVHRNLDAGSYEIEEEMLTSELGSSAGDSADIWRKRRVKSIKKKHGMQVFSFKTMVQATDNFASLNELGQGGYGIVYKGMLEDGQEVAIKRLSKTSKQGRLEFMNEVKLVANLQHTNLVKLIGCCIEQGEKMVVYEYMQNKSLDHFLFDTCRNSLLDWKKRFNIIEGVAQGLLYLHKFSRLKIIHRDLKAGNILLDQELNPKISDFGMAKVFEPTDSRTNAKRVVGTFGYMPPEYAKDGTFSFKTDVFSFGVLLLEIISSKKCNASYCLDRPMNLVGHAWERWTENRASELIDQALVMSGRGYAEAMKCINVSLLCVQESPTDRPTMSSVVAMISNEVNELPKPKKPAFYIENDLNQVHQQHDLEQGSLNGVSISEMEAR